MRPKTIDLDLDTPDPDGLADGNSSAGATVTLDGALTSGGTYTAADGIAKQISILDLGSDDQSGATFTVTGTDENDDAQTEAVTGPGVDATVESAKYFKTITGIAIASPVAGSTVDIGTVDEAVSPHIPVDRYAKTISYGVSVTGTINYTVQKTYQNPNAPTPETLAWIAQAAVKTADFSESLAPPCVLRLIVNSYSAGAALKLGITTQRRA